MQYRVQEGLKEDIREALCEYPDFLASLLARRQVLTKDDAQAFLDPQYDTGLHDPFLLKGMEEAVQRILAAIEKEELICIYSDYDADGIPGAVVLHDFFKKIGYDNFINYIPHRNKEGFGMNKGAVDTLAEKGVQLLITIDCGIGNAEEVQHANEKGIDVIITDHHLAHGDVPDACAIVNPNQPGCEYPNKHLCGAGVIFKVVQALIARGDFDIAEGWEKWLLDMVGISTVADMVSLTGENRVLAQYGLLVLRKSRRPGLQQLLRKARVKQKFLTEDDIGFMIAPRINAASRMDVPEDAFQMLATDNEIDADTLVRHLDSINTKRKTSVALMTKDIKKRIKQLGEPKEVIVMGNPDWMPSLAGLAANSLMDEFKRPAFVWGRGEASVYKGSCRGNGAVNLVTLMEGAQDTFIEFGGHACSGGFSVDLDNIHHLEDALIASYKALDVQTVEEDIELDASLGLRDVSWDTWRVLEKLAPFGEGNPKPVFLFKGVQVTGVKQFGKTKEHIELVVHDGDATQTAMTFFKTPESFTKTPALEETIDLVASFDVSHFKGSPELRLRIVDVV